MRLFIAALIAVTVAACASMGRPEGGPRDEQPPVALRFDPPQGARNVSPKRINIAFDENVNVMDVSSKVVVSPPQATPPQVFTNGRHLTVELRDTLIPDMTYTIDLADAVRDLNEGNILDGLAYDFSTGDNLDSLRISGMLFEARNLEPAQGMIVGVYAADTPDSALATLPMQRIARTDQYGRFTIRGLKEIPYRIYAVNDVNRDYHWDRSEDVAFYDTIITPAVVPIEVADTLASSLMTDSIVMRQGWQYLPNDILLTYFNVGYKPQYMTDHERPDSTTITIRFNTSADSLPQMTVVNGPHAGRQLRDLAVTEYSATFDTIKYHLTDRQIISQDSLLVAARYLKTDTLDQLSAVTDTLKFFFKRPKPKKVKSQENDTLPPPITFMDMSLVGGQTQEVYRPLKLNLSAPVATLDTAAISLAVQQDTLWVDLPRQTWTLEQTAPGQPLQYTVTPDQWQPGATYRLRVDSAAVTTVYGLHNNLFNAQFTIRPLEDYATLHITPEGIGSQPLVFELLDSKDEPVITMRHTAPTTTISFINPGTYYLRAFIDRNGNGIWDTGDINTLTQPEEIFYMPKKLNLKKNWEMTQTWDLYVTPVDKQKPLDILKNKPKTRDKAPEQTDGEDDEDDGDIFGANRFDTGGRKTQYNDIHRNR